MNYWVGDLGRCSVRQAECFNSVERSGHVSSCARSKLGNIVARNNEELLLTITGVHHNSVIDVTDTCPPVLLFFSVNNVIGSKLVRRRKRACS